MKTLEQVVPFDIGFPAAHFGQDPHYTGETQNNLIKASAQMQWVLDPKSVSA
jgi:hypothetical protein